MIRNFLLWFFRYVELLCLSLLGLGLLAFVLLLCFAPYLNERFKTPIVVRTDAPLTRSEFFREGDRLTLLAAMPALPQSAANICYANSKVGLDQAVLLRFDAPRADCAAFGELLLEGAGANATSLTRLTNPPESQLGMLREFGLESVDWFDIENIHDGFEGRRDATAANPAIQFWIDDGRGRFYLGVDY